MPGRRRRFFAEVLRRIWKFVALFLSVYLLAAVLFYLLQPGVSLSTSLYWAIVTLATVGYGDVVPTNGWARSMTAFLLFGQIFLGGYLVSVITSTFIDESQKEALGTLGTDLEDHIVVLGFGGVGRAAVRELLGQDLRVAVVAEAPEQVANIRTLGPASRLFATYGAAADLDILRRVNVPKAHSVIVCTTDDATNMIASLNIRALAPRARIVVSVQRPELRDTLRAAGVTYVASPSEMGGRLCASAAFEPDVALALEDITSADVQSDMQEYLLRPGCPIATGSFEEIERAVRQASGALLLGYARRRPD
ncbi:MAG: potassium channel family protein, partial [Thermoplasmata archaeon]|nr:potassium channel family protein [Thermoplasmata archaeon]